MRRWKLSKACAAIILAALAFVGCAASSSRESAGGYLDDAAITTKAKSSFVADPQVSALAINVQSSQGVGQLSLAMPLGLSSRRPSVIGFRASTAST
jgi:osmotically-inducible protein OsmY